MMITDFEQQLLERLHDADAGVRRIAVLDLLDSDEANISPLLITALHDPDAGVRVEAARLLEGYETHDAVRALIAALDDPDKDVAHAAADSLAELKEREMAEPLLAALAEQVTPSKQAALLRAVRELRAADAFAPAMSALDSDSSVVRCAGVGVLGYLRNTDALPDIAKIAATDPDPEARRIAIGALGFSTDAIVVKQTLVAALRDGFWQVREEAAVTLGKLKFVDAANDLVPVMTDAYWQVRVKAARSLGKLKARSALPVLIDALNHEISNLRKEAVVALGEIGDVAAIPALENALYDSDPDVRKLARLALTQLST